MFKNRSPQIYLGDWINALLKTLYSSSPLPAPTGAGREEGIVRWIIFFVDFNPTPKGVGYDIKRGISTQMSIFYSLSIRCTPTGLHPWLAIVSHLTTGLPAALSLCVSTAAVVVLTSDLLEAPKVMLRNKSAMNANKNNRSKRNW